MARFPERQCVCPDGLSPQCANLQVFSNEMPDGVTEWQCRYCGSWHAREATEAEKREYRMRLNAINEAWPGLGDAGT